MIFGVVLDLGLFNPLWPVRRTNSILRRKALWPLLLQRA
jgi:hypothetical protein